MGSLSACLFIDYGECVLSENYTLVKFEWDTVKDKCDVFCPITSTQRGTSNNEEPLFFFKRH